MLFDLIVWVLYPGVFYLGMVMGGLMAFLAVVYVVVSQIRTELRCRDLYRTARGKRKD